MRLLVFGETGQVARELARAAEARGIALAALGRDRADLADPAACAAAVADAEACAVINAAAYTAVDRAEAEPGLAHAVNAAAPGAMARAAAARGLPFLHVSTDYVFDGAPGRPWREDDPTGPLGVYGASKLAGERAVAQAGGPHAILRTAWVFSSHGANFVKTMLRLGAERDALRVVDDQIGGPTPARDIAEALLDIAAAFAAGRGVSGVFHFAGSPATSWAGFARAIFAARSGTFEAAPARGESRKTMARGGNPPPPVSGASRDAASGGAFNAASGGPFNAASGGGASEAAGETSEAAARGGRGPEVIPIPSADYPTPARRPLNSVLDCAKIQAAYGIGQPDWRAGLKAVLGELS